MFYITYTDEMSDMDAWKVGEDVVWKRLSHAKFNTQEDADFYVIELKRLDRINGVTRKYAVNEETGGINKDEIDQA